MKLLFDEMMPEELAPFLEGHDVSHVIDLGWRHVVNGKLLAMAEAAGFEVFVTKDGNLPFQQNMAGRQISILVLRPSSQSLPDLFALVPRILEALAVVTSGTFRIVFQT